MLLLPHLSTLLNISCHSLLFASCFFYLCSLFLTLSHPNKFLYFYSHLFVSFFFLSNYLIIHLSFPTLSFIFSSTSYLKLCFPLPPNVALILHSYLHFPIPFSCNSLLHRIITRILLLVKKFKTFFTPSN